MSEDRISVVQRCLIGAFVVLCVVLCDSAGAQDRPKEKIVFSISTGGYAEYNDLGIIDRNGKKVKLVTFRTHIGGLMDGFERIYGEPDTFLPVRIERNVVFALRKEYLVEDYSPATSSVSIKKYVRDKFLAEYRITRDRPIQNAILLRSYLRTVKDLHVGWSVDIVIPDRYTVTLESFEDIDVPGGKFSTYHFVSSPRQFELWVTRDAYRIPVRLAVKKGYRTTVEMKAYSISQ
ncbi:MAG TPA: hypothetical protein PLJ26_06800 [Candidatus Omnitrophota bacterium]|nr:hypothetical protein [Candidatus Omnitrophota bacterium]